MTRWTPKNRSTKGSFSKSQAARTHSDFPTYSSSAGKQTSGRKKHSRRKSSMRRSKGTRASNSSFGRNSKEISLRSSDEKSRAGYDSEDSAKQEVRFFPLNSHFSSIAEENSTDTMTSSQFGLPPR